MTPGMIFTAFFVMLGPMKMIFPFFTLISSVPVMEESEARRASVKAIAIACGVGILAAILGQNVLKKWGLSLPALHLAAGIVLLLVALQSLLASYSPPPEIPESHPRRLNFILSPLVYPIILSPYGIATFILILASKYTLSLNSDLLVVGMFLAVMAVNLVVMWFARTIVRYGGSFLLILGAVFGVLQVALAIKMILDALVTLRVLEAL